MELEEKKKVWNFIVNNRKKDIEMTIHTNREIGCLSNFRESRIFT